MRILTSLLALVWSATLLAQPATKPADVDKFPGIHIDVAAKKVVVDCEAIDCKNPLEFFCVVAGTSEHEAILRTKARPSQIHTALLMLGLEPGEGVKYSDAAKKWIPPHGPPLHITCEFEKDGKTITVPAYRMMRDIKTKKEMPSMTWIFVGSKVMQDGNYAADVTGYVVSVVNFELTLIDIPDLASSSNETLEWVQNEQIVPARGTAVKMIIEPAGDVEHATTQPAEQVAPGPTTKRLSDVTIDQEKVDRLVQLWKQKVAPHDQALKEAAQAQYDTISALRREQQRLIDEADRIQRTIDELEKKYQDMTTPRPEPVTP
jgi:hypothetical protein